MKTQDTLTVMEVYRAVWMQCHVSHVCVQCTVTYCADVAISLFKYYAELINYVHGQSSSVVLHACHRSTLPRSYNAIVYDISTASIYFHY